MSKQHHRVDLNHYARIMGSPGERPRLVGLMRAAWPLCLWIFFAGFVLGMALPGPGLDGAGAGVVLLCLCMAGAVMLRGSEQRLGRFFKGARGEESVARALALLPSDYRVFHGVSINGAQGPGNDIDHVVIGPSGIFAVETKNWSGIITIKDGMVCYDDKIPNRPPLQQVKLSASALAQNLGVVLSGSVSVQPVLCFAGARPPKRIQGVGGVVVCIPESIAEVVGESNPDAPAPALMDRVARHLSAGLEV